MDEQDPEEIAAREENEMLLVLRNELRLYQQHRETNNFLSAYQMFQVAAGRGYWRVIETALAERQNVLPLPDFLVHWWDWKGIYSLTPLHDACSAADNHHLAARYFRCVELLLGAGADPNSRDELPPHETVLHTAVRFAPLAIIQALLDAGANIQAQSGLDEDDSDVEEEEEEEDDDDDDDGGGGDTPLHVATRLGRLDVLREFIERRGARVSWRNRRNQTPLDIAMQNMSRQASETTLGETETTTATGTATPPTDGLPRAKHEEIIEYFIQQYARQLVQDAPRPQLSVHAALEELVFSNPHPLGSSLETPHWQLLLDGIVKREPGTIRVRNSDGDWPLQAAIRLGCPYQVVYVLLRHHPAALYE